MFTREKYCKNNQTLNHSSNSKNIISSIKYHQRTYQKTKKQITKKNKCDRLWKKQSSYIYWSEKENDKNSLNYNYSKKPHYDNKRKIFKYHKKSSKNELNFNPNFNDENNNKKENGADFKLNKIKYENKDKSLKDEKNNSFEFTRTTSYSNSTSAHEESNSNILNVNEEINITNFILNKRESNDNINKIFSFIEQPNKILSLKSENFQENKILNNNKNTNEQIFSNSLKNFNFMKLNSCLNPSENFPTPSSSQIPKVQNINKYSDNISSEPYNKYNSINQDLNQLWINPIAENTEILKVNVKISKNKTTIFKLRRFDDLFLTVKLFCEINAIDEKFMKPIIIKALCALNNIYQVINTKLDSKNIKRLKMLNTFVNNTYI